MEHQHEHTHTDAFGNVYTHSHDGADGHAHPKDHGHVHDPAEKKRQINRLARIIGHLEKVRRMLEADEDCSAVLMQLSASRSALNGLAKEIINEHMTHCIAHAIEEGDNTAVTEFREAIQKYL